MKPVVVLPLWPMRYEHWLHAHNIQPMRYQAIVDSIQGAIKDVTQIITDVEGRSQTTNEEALKAEQAISQIQEAVANISSMNVQIASATDEQSRVTRDLSENVTGISDLSA